MTQKGYKISKYISCFVIGICFVLMLILIISPHYIAQWFNYDISRLGQFGDYYSGTIGIIISVAGIFALILAYISQREQIDIQREELNRLKTSENIKNYEDKFYKLLEMFLQSKNNVYHTIELTESPSNTLVNIKDIKKKKTIIYGVICFKYLADSLKANLEHHIYSKHKDSGENIIEVSVKEKITDSLNSLVILKSYNFFNSNKDKFNQYSKLFYSILYYLYESRESRYINLKNYINIFISNISNKELFILFFYGIIYPKEHQPNQKILMRELDMINYFNITEIEELSKYYKTNVKNFLELYNYDN